MKDFQAFIVKIVTIRSTRLSIFVLAGFETLYYIVWLLGRKNLEFFKFQGGKPL